MRRSTPIIMAAVLATLLVAAPASANHPETTQELTFGQFYDPQSGNVVLANISRDAMCVWVAGGYAGPPPVYEPATFRWIDTRQGATLVSFRAIWQLEAWSLATQPLSDQDICDGTAGQVHPWATGTGRIVSTDNDFFISGTRTNAFGFTMTGVVYDADGTAHRFLRVNRSMIQNDEERQLALVIRLR